MSPLLMVVGMALASEPPVADEAEEPEEPSASEQAQTQKDHASKEHASEHHEEAARPKIRVSAWARASLRVMGEEEVNWGGTVDMARILVSGSYADWASATVQVDAALGTSFLLDAKVRLGKKDGVSITVGRFKNPVSYEYLVPAPKLLLPSRNMLVLYVPRRQVGAAVTARTAIGKQRGTITMGVFNPTGLLPKPSVGVQATARVLLETSVGLEVHLAGSAWIHGDAKPDDEIVLPQRDLVLDGALAWKGHGWELSAEGLYGFRTDGDVDGGFSTQVARSFQLTSDWSLLPAVRYDLWMGPTDVWHRADAGLSLRWHEHRVVVFVAGGADVVKGRTFGSGRLTAQVGF